MSNTKESALLPSDWARAQYEAALERGDSASAQDYLSIYELWKSRNQ